MIADKARALTHEAALNRALTSVTRAAANGTAKAELEFDDKAIAIVVQTKLLKLGYGAEIEPDDKRLTFTMGISW